MASEAQRKKVKFRQTSRWKKFRQLLGKKRKVDALTLRPLLSGWQLHHCCLDEDKYTDISDESSFECLNKRSHEMIHFLFNYYKKDHSILLRLRDILDKMERLSE